MAITRTLIQAVHEAEEQHKEMARFLLVGGSGTVLNFFVLTLTYHYFHWPVILAALVSNELAMVSNFFCHEHWTFNGDRHGTRRLRFVRYQFVAAGGIVLSSVILTVLVRVGLHYLIANLIAIGIAVSWNFFMSHRWAWRRTASELLENVA